MSKTIQFTHDGRELEVKTNIRNEAIEIWIFEDGRTLKLYTAIPFDDAADAKATGKDVVVIAMQAARSDVETGVLALPKRTAV
jgi:hypothetical protein